jgi:hypothetical protein
MTPSAPDSSRLRSFYVSEPSVPPLRIRSLTHRKSEYSTLRPAIALPSPAGSAMRSSDEPSEPSYADFIGGSATLESARLDRASAEAEQGLTA